MLRNSALAALLFPLVLACSVSETEPVIPDTPEKEAPAAIDPYLPGRVTVEFDEDMTVFVEEALSEGGLTTATKALGADLSVLGIKSLRRVFPDAGKFEPRTRREGLHRFYYVEFDENVPVTKASGELGNLPGVVSASPELPIRPRVSFNDPYLSMQWHYINTRYTGADINVKKVWDNYTVGDPRVIVSVVDEGVNLTHEDLAANVIPCYEDGTGSFNFNNDTPTVVPTQGHGSHVAGIIAAVNNNGKGVCGIAGGDYAAGKPGARVMSCQIFDQWGNEPDIYEAIKHGADNGAVILQCSWGFSPDLDGDGFTTDEEIAAYRSVVITDPVLKPYKAAIDYFIKYAGCDNDGNQLPDSPMKGGVAIFASGNDNFDYDPLVSYDPIIAVGAFGATGNKASYSNYGEWVDVAAPGGEIKMGIYSTLTGNAYGGADWIGTSMACPHVSGVAALLVSYFGGPGFTAEECRTRIIHGAVPNAFTGSKYIGRKLDAYGAFTYDMATPQLPPVLSWTDPVVENGTATLSYSFNKGIRFSVSDPNDLSVTLSLSGDKYGCALDKDEEGYFLSVNAAKVGVGEHNLLITGKNQDYLTGELPLKISVRENEAPVLNSEAPTALVLGAPAAVLAIQPETWIVDPDGDPVSFTLSVEPSTLAEVVFDEENGYTLKALASGTGQLVVEATDGMATSKLPVDLAVKNPDYPAYITPTMAEDHIDLHIESEKETTVSYKVYSATGSLALSGDAEASLFAPLRVNVRSLVPGRYAVRLSYNGTVYSAYFIKR